MSEFTDASRRWTGAVFLTIAAGMLVLGLTVLESSLKDFTYILYWMTCLAFTLSAATVALLDVIIVKRRSREELRNLLEKTLKGVEESEGGVKSKPDKRPDK